MEREQRKREKMSIRVMDVLAASDPALVASDRSSVYIFQLCNRTDAKTGTAELDSSWAAGAGRRVEHGIGESERGLRKDTHASTRAAPRTQRHEYTNNMRS